MSQNTTCNLIEDTKLDYLFSYKDKKCISMTSLHIKSDFVLPNVHTTASNYI